MSTETLTRIRVTSNPTFMVKLFSTSNAHKCGAVKIILSTELSNAINMISNALRINDNEGFHWLYTKLSILPHFYMDGAKSSMYNFNWNIALSKTPALNSFCALRSAFNHICTLADSFFTILSTKIGNTQLFTGRKRWFMSNTRACNTINVEASLSEGLKLVKPVLFSHEQEWTKHEFDHFENEGRFPILIESALQFGVAVSAVVKITKVLISTLIQIHSATYVELACNGASNLVDTRSGRNRGHLLTPLVSPLCCLLPGSQGHCFSSGVITPSLDNTSIIPFPGRW